MKRERNKQTVLQGVGGGGDADEQERTGREINRQTCTEEDTQTDRHIYRRMPRQTDGPRQS